ncbi:uncharacterized protein BJ171DRAFT_490236 [Polychytrium aggregatum]|uniref:uncharacterized protein n=1 Tax=Polychytrium aggregatum TaxID=110093 RepID=UPI0022FEB34A|nr:uncharacterized protein BJ171DRAFT_490236 [Polychytrium aggregatum]KAI9208101.1 hypothetical protein BJ171DRAFT_490236 [Polychytrium aggregatum]
MVDSDYDEAEFELFKEPDNFRPATPEPTFQIVEREPEVVEPGSVSSFKIRLVAQHSLWAHCLWNAGVCLARHIDRNRSLVRGKCILELGAAAGLPSLTAALVGAQKVLMTDYPEPVLIDNMRFNAKENLPDATHNGVIGCQGFLWGADPFPLLDWLKFSNAGPEHGARKYDLIFLADLIFNHTEHRRMLKTIDECLTDEGEAIVIFSHHRPWLKARDMKFFEIASAPRLSLPDAPNGIPDDGGSDDDGAETDGFGFRCEHMWDERMPAMFPTDPGDEAERSTVHCWRITRR